MSEWVATPDRLVNTTKEFLKGGTWWLPGEYANGGCLLAVTSKVQGSFAGIRVVRRLSAEGRAAAAMAAGR
jgi:hypothetical protein